MYLTLLVLPLLGALLSVNRKCGLKGGPILSTVIMIATTLIGFNILIEVGFNGSPVSLKLMDWIVGSYINIEWVLVFDSLTVSMLIPVLLVSSLVQLYSLEYMANDPHKPRFFSYLSIFTFFMLILLTGENLLVMFVGWEGVGLASYLLVNFWFTRVAANMAALKAFLMNRVGDWGLTLAIIFAILIMGDISFSGILSMALYINPDLILIFCILALIGASAKSGQIGLHTWLPSAMEGPTPVSALLHAATMVTAGVYLLIRLSPLLEWSSDSLLLITWVGGLSAALGAAAGLLENDLKRVIAFSTTSQLGYMIVACGLSQYSLSLFHLINHAFFKALLFLSAGAVIHALADQQDMRKMGGLVLFLPTTYSLILLASLSLMAFPFLTGFYSKDLILELALIPKNFTRSIAYLLALFAAFLSAIYSVRLLILTFLSKPHFPKSILPFILEPSLPMLLPMILLSLGSAFFGYLTHDLFLGIGHSFYLNAIFTHPNNISLLAPLGVPSSFFKYLPLLTLLILFSLFPFSSNSSSHYSHSSKSSPIIVSSWKNPSLYTSFLNHFNIYYHWLIFNSLIFANNILRNWDRGLVEILGPYGLVKLISYLAFRIELIASGRLIHYAFIIIFISIFTILAGALPPLFISGSVSSSYFSMSVLFLLLSF